MSDPKTVPPAPVSPRQTASESEGPEEPEGPPGSAGKSESHDAAPQHDEFANLLRTVDDETEHQDAESLGPLSSPELLSVPQISGISDSPENDDLTDLSQFAAVLPSPLPADPDDDGDESGPLGSFQFDLSQFESEEGEAADVEMSDFVKLLPLPELDHDDDHAEVEIDIGSVSLEDSPKIEREEIRFRLALHLKGTFDALCKGPEGLIAAASVADDRSQLYAPVSNGTDPLGASPPGKVLSLTCFGERLLAACHTGGFSQTTLSALTAGEWLSPPGSPGCASKAMVIRRFHQISGATLAELTDGRLTTIQPDHGVATSGSEPKLDDGTQFAQWLGPWQASLTPSGVLLSRNNGERSHRLKLDSAIGIGLGQLDGQFCAWVVVDDFASDRSRVIELDLETLESVVVADLPRTSGSDELVIQDTLWDFETRTLYLATSAGLYGLERLAA